MNIEQNILYESSMEFAIAIKEVANPARHQIPSSSSEFFAVFCDSSDWDIVEILEPDEIFCPHCRGPVISDQLMGYDCPICGDDVIG